jgi:hypothetical protein
MLDKSNKTTENIIRKQKKNSSKRILIARIAGFGITLSFPGIIPLSENSCLLLLNHRFFLHIGQVSY